MYAAWYNFSSWPHIDITTLGCSVTWPHFFLQLRCFWDNMIKFLFLCVGGPSYPSVLWIDRGGQASLKCYIIVLKLFAYYSK